MGLDDFSSGDSDSSSDEDSWEDDWGSEESDEDQFPPKEVIANILLHHSHNKGVDIEVDGRELKGSAEDFAMIFALMFLDYPDADPYSLEDPR